VLNEARPAGPLPARARTRFRAAPGAPGIPPERTFGEAAAAAVPAEGVTDVHTYVVATLGGRDVVLDATFPGPEWDGVSDMPVAAADGEDFPAGADPAATKAALVEAHCDPAVREPFIAALSRSGYSGPV
jgi:hypothetical protein